MEESRIEDLFPPGRLLRQDGQGEFRLPPPGDVLHLRDHVVRPVVAVAHQRNGQEHGEDPAVAVEVAFFLLEGGNLPRREPAHPLAARRQIIRMRDVRKSPGQQLGFRIADQEAERPVDLEPAPLNRHQRHPDRRVLKSTHEALLAFPEGLRRHALFPPQGGLRQGVRHRRAQAGEPVLHQIIGGSSLDRLHGGGLPDGPRDENERHLESALPEQFEGPHPVELRQLEIRQDQIEVGPQASEEGRFRLHPFPDWREPSLTELKQLQLGIGRGILDNQELQRSRHCDQCPIRGG